MQNFNRLIFNLISILIFSSSYEKILKKRPKNTSTIGEALKEIIEKNVYVMPIINNQKRVVGFISDSDILRAMSHSDLPVSDYSTLITGLAKNELPKVTS